MLPKSFTPYSTVHAYFYEWQANGLWLQITIIIMATRELEGKEASPTAGVIDSQRGKTTESGGIARYDASTLWWWEDQMVRLVAWCSASMVDSCWPCYRRLLLHDLRYVAHDFGVAIGEIEVTAKLELDGAPLAATNAVLSVKCSTLDGSNAQQLIDRA